MNNPISKETLLSVFPIALDRQENLHALAVIVAEHFATLYKEGNLAALYTRIDTLGADLLDTLAYDFKIDWWDSNYTVDEKRRLFKSCFDVHRKLGTPAAIVAAVESIYTAVQVREWWQYGGRPYRFRISIDTGGEFFDSAKFASVVSNALFYKNLRSILEEVDFTINRMSGIYVGCATQQGTLYTATITNVPASETLIADEQENYLSDENRSLLIL